MAEVKKNNTEKTTAAVISEDKNINNSNTDNTNTTIHSNNKTHPNNKTGPALIKNITEKEEKLRNLKKNKLPERETNSINDITNFNQLDELKSTSQSKIIHVVIFHFVTLLLYMLWLLLENFTIIQRSLKIKRLCD